MAKFVTGPRENIWPHDLPDPETQPEQSIWLCEHCDRYFKVVIADGGWCYWRMIGFFSIVDRLRISRALEDMCCEHDQEAEQ